MSVGQVDGLRDVTWKVLCLCLMGCDFATSPPAPAKDLKHFDGAIEFSSSASDDRVAALYVKAGDRLVKGDLAAAKKIYRQLIEEYPRDPDGYASLGTCFYFEKNFDEAEQQYLRALELDKKCVNAYYGLGCVAYERQDYTEASRQLKKALALSPNHQDSLRVLEYVREARTRKRLQVETE